MPASRIYLDTNATAPLAPEVREAMEPWLHEVPSNPSGIHEPARRARAAVEDARDRVGELCGEDFRVVFTSGGTEADNLALWSAAGLPPTGHLVVSAIEHPAIHEPARALTALGVDVDLVPVDADGRVAPEAVQEALREDTRLVSIMTANNEIGTLQPISRIVEIAHARGVPVHTDAVQAAAWLDLADELGEIDMVSLSGHKIGGPPGIGALLLRTGVEVREPLIRGGGQQSGRRAGTEPTILTVGFGAACARVARRRDREARRVAALADALRSGIESTVPDIQETGTGAPRLPNTVHVCFPDCAGDALVARLDLDGVAASAGSACASGVAHGSAVLEAIGLPPRLQAGAVRFSLGYHTSEDEIAAAIERIAAAVEAVRAASLPAGS